MLNPIRPRQNFQLNGSGWGAWELAFGYDFVDLNSGVIRGGQMDLVRFALNWYPHPLFKIQNNIIYTLNIDTSGVANARSAGFNNGQIQAPG